jgi:hypothetical protein
MDDKAKLTKCQNHHHHGGVFDTWTKRGQTQAEWAQGLTGRPNSLAGQLGFKAGQPETWLPRVYTRRRSPSRWKLIHSAGRPCGLAARPPPGTKPTSPIDGGPIHPYKYPPHGESRHTHHYLKIPLVKLSFLV